MGRRGRGRRLRIEGTSGPGRRARCAVGRLVVNYLVPWREHERTSVAYVRVFITLRGVSSLGTYALTAWVLTYCLGRKRRNLLVKGK